MDNMYIYKQLCETPKEAQKEIKGGRLNGFTDINPMWRIKVLTQTFGACGTGWKIEILDKRIEPGANGETAAFVDLNLFYKDEQGKWSDGVYGSGGSSFISKERNGLYTSDECYKMAVTDAIGSACKLLGMSADIFFEKDRTKYTFSDKDVEKDQTKYTPSVIETVSNETKLCSVCLAKIDDAVLRYSVTNYHRPLCRRCQLNEVIEF